MWVDGVDPEHLCVDIAWMVMLAWLVHCVWVGGNTMSEHNHPAGKYSVKTGNTTEWIVYTWDDFYGCYRESAPTSYYLARLAVGRENCRRKNCAIEGHNHRSEV